MMTEIKRKDKNMGKVIEEINKQIEATKAEIAMKRSQLDDVENNPHSQVQIQTDIAELAEKLEQLENLKNNYEHESSPAGKAKHELEQQGVVFHTWDVVNDGWGFTTYGGIIEIGNSAVLRKVKYHQGAEKMFMETGAGSVPFDLKDFRITLNSKAKTNKGREFPVRLEKNHEGKWVLNILGTPGKWYMETLREGEDGTRETLSIHGNDWIWVNFQEVMEEANSHRGVK